MTNSHSIGAAVCGAEVLISTKNQEAVKAIHDFLAFQRMDHRAGMH